MARKTGELKKRCWLAKQRLKMGYWESIKREKQTRDGAVGARAVVAEFARQLGRDAEIAASANAADEKMYKKVCDILDCNEIAINPIGQLIERDVYDKLDAAGRQRYVLELSEKFRELQERYRRERTAT